MVLQASYLCIAPVQAHHRRRRTVNMLNILPMILTCNAARFCQSSDCCKGLLVRDASMQLRQEQAATANGAKTMAISFSCMNCPSNVTYQQGSLNLTEFWSVNRPAARLGGPGPDQRETCA